MTKNSWEKENCNLCYKNFHGTEIYMEAFSLSEKKTHWQVYNEIGHTATKSYGLLLIKEG